MAEQQGKLKKLYNARSNLESELPDIHKDITDDIDWQDRMVRVERLLSKLKDVFNKPVQNNEEHIWLDQLIRETRFNLSCPGAMAGWSNYEQW